MIVAPAHAQGAMNAEIVSNERRNADWRRAHADPIPVRTRKGERKEAAAAQPLPSGFNYVKFDRNL
jgi:hypothetical protein